MGLESSSQANQDSPLEQAISDDNTKTNLANNVICEAFGCNATATNKITVRIGDNGRVSLLLCDKCKLKFHS
jgi:hypothetical protein